MDEKNVVYTFKQNNWYVSHHITLMEKKLSMKQPLLSICIPTYNRCEYLEKSIESIILQKEFFDGSVEIVISDNASNDRTQQIGNEYANKYNNIHYHRNEKNIMDRNYPIVISKATGELRRLSNDTLIYSPGSLSHMCQIIEENKERRPHIFLLNNMKKMKCKEQNVNFRTFIRLVSYWITSIASFCIWEEDCENINSDTFGCDLRLWQVRKGLELAYKCNQVLICNRPLAKFQKVQGKDLSYGIYDVFYENYFELLSPYFSNGSLNRTDRELLEKDLLYNFFAEWCIKWELQRDSMQFSETENLKKAVYDTYCIKPYWHNYQNYYYRKLLLSKAKLLVEKVIGER